MGVGRVVCLFAQVYSADEKRALAQFNYEEKVPTPCDAQHAAYKHGARARRARAPTSSVLPWSVGEQCGWVGHDRLDTCTSVGGANLLDVMVIVEYAWAYSAARAAGCA